jgi:hypothetical protein
LRLASLKNIIVKIKDLDNEMDMKNVPASVAIHEIDDYKATGSKVDVQF